MVTSRTPRGLRAHFYLKGSLTAHRWERYRPAYSLEVAPCPLMASLRPVRRAYAPYEQTETGAPVPDLPLEKLDSILSEITLPDSARSSTWHHRCRLQVEVLLPTFQRKVGATSTRRATSTWSKRLIREVKWKALFVGI